MTPAPSRGLEGQSLSAFGMQPSGMLRIRLDQQERYIWPVHLPGWLAAGWRVAELPALHGTEPLLVDPADAPQTAPLTAVAETTPQPEAGESPDVPLAPTRGRRGRRRKEDPSPAATDQVDTEPAVVSSQDSTLPGPLLADSDATGDGTDHVLGESGSDVTAETASDSRAAPSADSALAVDPEATEVPVLTALPDDLFHDQLT
jgi:hypothetical protein